MTPYYSDNGITLYNGDCREVLASLPDQSVNCGVTSPPYWGLRDYGVDGQIGLEQTPDAYVAEMVSLFREFRRVLKDDGTLWLNIGDSYNAYNGGSGPGGWGGARDDARPALDTGYGLRFKGLKPKDLVGIPWRVAFALQADGWYLRGDNVWAKPNCMPESVEDRTTRSHEYVFHFSKSQRYFYNAEAVRTAPKASTETRLNQNIEDQIGSIRANGGAKTNGTMKAVGRDYSKAKPLPSGQSNLRKLRDKQRGHSRRHDGFNDRWDAMERDEQMSQGANLRSVWWISPAQYAAAHFAVMPEKLAAICVAAGCPDGGTVLDPFFGAGTTGLVCQSQGVNCIGIDLNKSYCDIARKRLAQGVLFGAKEAS